MSEKVLIVIDMQNDFIDGSLGTPEAQKIVSNVVNEINKKKNDDYLILATQDTHFSNYLDSFEGKNLPIPHCIENTDGWKINALISPLIEKNDIYTKPTFGSWDLLDRIREENPEEIEIIGLCTDICVISNALMIRAQFPDRKIVVKADCCAGVSPELHQSALDVMKSCQIEIQ